MDSNKKVGIIGAGSFGTALAMVLANKGHQVTLWARDFMQISYMEKNLENKHYLPDVKLPKTIEFTSDLEIAVSGKDYLVFAVPAQSFRGVFEKSCQYFDSSVPVINVAKGIEKGTMMRLSEVAEKIRPDVRYAALSGPSHAEEVGRGLPTTLVVGAKKKATAEYIQNIFMGDVLRVYTSPDVKGIELGGALKNVVALAAGIAAGLGYGDNTMAALITRGIAEITQIGLALGCQYETFAGLTGIGDLIVTCASKHSRNRRAGMLIGQGYTMDEAMAEVKMIVEGVYSAKAGMELANKYHLEVPIIQQVNEILFENKSASEAVNDLMFRDKKVENSKLKWED